MVANDYHIDGKQINMMVITGPNTGGKTVSLKTIGLLTMMAQSGLALPTNEGAIVGVFESFFVDIGDDQSIEDSLSTFSSHMSKLVNMTKHVDEKSLVLLDEIGGGTNPNEGEAIAMALLDFFTSKRALVVATTHYSNLKSYALDKGNIAITSMEFDSVTMRPTYRLLRGVFGRSYAFEISQNLGLSPEILKKAKKYKDYYASQIDLLTEKLDIQRLEIETQVKEILAQKKDLATEKTALQTARDKYEQLQRELREKADDQVAELIEEAVTQIEKVKSDLLQQGQIKLHHAIDAKRQLESLKSVSITEDSARREFEIGENVFIKSIRKNGKVTRKKGLEYVVSINGMTLGTTLDDLDIALMPSDKDTIPKHHVAYQRSGNQVPLELLLIGMRVEEALEKCDKYVDDALSVHYKTIRIVHGHGTGALRKAVHQWLDNHPHVESYRLGGAGEGGLGATVATLK